MGWQPQARRAWGWRFRAEHGGNFNITAKCANGAPKLLSQATPGLGVLKPHPFERKKP